MVKLVFTILFLTTCYFLNAQSVARQSIGTLGKTHHGNSITVQQSVGQVYNTKTFYGNEVGTRPGFIQPQKLIIEPIRSSMASPIELTIFPNPASETVVFNSEEHLQNLVLTVQNTLGAVIKTEHIASLEGYTLDCSQWPSETYFIRLTDESNQTYYSKLIKK